MSGRGIDFLGNWVNKNFTAADRKGSQDRATELAAECYQVAAAFGISIDDMEPEWGTARDCSLTATAFVT